MKSIKRFFSPNSSTSPSDSKSMKKSSPSSHKHEKMYRSNSSSAIIDSNSKDRSLKSAGALYLDTNVHQYRHHSAANSPISYNIINYNNTTPTTTNSSPVDSELFNYRRQNLSMINTTAASSSTSIDPPIDSPN